MIQPITVRVHDVIEGPLCISLEDGQRLHDKILPLLQAEKPIALSFERIDAIISAFLGSAIGQLYGELPEDHIDKFLSVRDMADDDREVLIVLSEMPRPILALPKISTGHGGRKWAMMNKKNRRATCLVMHPAKTNLLM